MLPLPRGAVLPLLFLLCALLYINGVQSDGRVVCYYTNWSVYRPGTAKYNPQNINPYLCTHLIYAFGGFTKDNQMKPFDKYQDIEQGGYAKFTGLKTYNKQLKTMIAIGGWNEASTRFSPLVASAERRQKFIKNILKFLRQNHFDGIDLDWEYPAHRTGGRPQDRENYAQFVQELRAEFEREAEKTGRPRLLLTMAVPAGIEYIEKGYDIPKLNKYLDWFNLLTYDFHASTEPSANHHAPLYSLEEDSEYNYDAELNIDYSVKFYLNAGADRDKLVLGIPTYGRSFTLINEESTEIGAPSEGPGEQGDATREKGYLAYYEICQNIKEDPEWTVVQPNPNAVGPYAYRRNQWVGYDDEAIVRKKAQYVVDNGLGGIMFWAIDNDDFRGTCTGKPYPLIEAAKEAMLDALGLGINEVSKPSAPQKPSRGRSRENSSSSRNNIETTEHKLTYAERKSAGKRTGAAQGNRNRVQASSTTTTVAPLNFKLTEAEGSSLYIGGRTTTPPPPTTPDPGTDFKCEEEGFFQHPRDCKKYYWCLDSGPSGLGIVAHQFTCPSGLYFNPAADSCDFARNVPCKTKKSTTAAPVTTAASTPTTARPNRIAAATTRNPLFRAASTTTTTTTTTAAPDYNEYEEDDEDQHSLTSAKHHLDKESEEDPKVIKELIELIRKVGGIEELEKHLSRKDDGTISLKTINTSSSSSSDTSSPTTPSSISKSLYDKVLSKPNALNSIRKSFKLTNTRTTTTQSKKANQDSSDDDDEQSDAKTSSYSKYSSVVRGANSRQGPQNEGIDKLAESEGFTKEKKQYITINRNRGSQKSSRAEEETEEETVVETEESDAKSSRRSNTGTTLNYSSIRRTRPTTTTSSTVEEDDDDDASEQDSNQGKDVTERKQYSSLNRSRTRISSSTTTEPEATEVTSGSARYKYLERSRPSKTTTEASQDDEDDNGDDDNEDSLDHENTVHVKADKKASTQEITTTTTTNTQQKTYASIGRSRTTTVSPSDTPPESTTTATPETTTTTAPSPAVLTTPTPDTPITSSPITPILDTITNTPETIVTSHHHTGTTVIPIDTNTNPQASTPLTKTTGTTTTTVTATGNLDVSTTTITHPNDIPDMDPETLNLSLKINSLMSDSSLNPITESGLDTQQKEEEDSDDNVTTTTSTSTTEATTTVSTTEATTENEVNVVIKERSKTRTRTTATVPPSTTTTTNPTQRYRIRYSPTTTESPEVDSTQTKQTSSANIRSRKQQILQNRSSQTTNRTRVTTTELTPTITTETNVNNEFLGTVSSPRPFGFPKKRTRVTTTTTGGSGGPTTTTSTKTTTTTTTITEESPDSNVGKSSSNTKQKAAVNTQVKKLRISATGGKNGLLGTRRPVLSVRKRLITTTTTTPAPTSLNSDLNAAAEYESSTNPTNTATKFEQQHQANAITTTTSASFTDGDVEYTTTSKYNRIRTLRPSAYTYFAATSTPATTLATYAKAGNKSKSQQRNENELRLTPSATSAASSASGNDIEGKQQTKNPSASSSLRRKYQARRLTTTTASSTNPDGSATEPPRTQNPLFKRRFSLTTTLPPFTGRTLLPTTTITTTTRIKSTNIRPGIGIITTDVPLQTSPPPPSEVPPSTTGPYFESLDNEEDTDQVAKSSIHTSLFNQINGRLHLDDEDEIEAEGVVVTRLANNQKSLLPTTTTRDPTSKFLHRQQQQKSYQQHHQQQQAKYNLEDVITRRMDDSSSAAKSSAAAAVTAGGESLKLTTKSSLGTSTTPRSSLKKRKLVVKQKPPAATPTSTLRDNQRAGSNRRPHKYQEPLNRLNSYETKSVTKASQAPGRTYRPNIDYDYYDDEESRVVGNRKDQQLKVILHGGGLIECLDQGNFPHPLSCRKFISCAKFETGGVVGWEYTCPKGLSYDPVGGMCNWAAGLGCNE